MDSDLQVSKKKILYFKKIVILTKANSTCARLAVGALITTLDGYILSTGYNGVPSGMAHCNLMNKLGVTPCNCIHAEQNAIIRCSESWRTPKICYVTAFPCLSCAKLLAGINVKKIFYIDDYREQNRSMTFLDEAGIKYEKI